MTVLVVGSGAVGSLLAATLAAGGRRVWLTRRGAPAGGDDVRVVTPDGVRRAAQVTRVESAAALPAAPEVVILAVKMYDLDGALRALPDWPATAVVTVQNGIGAEELALATRPTGPLVAGSLTASVARDADGAIRWVRRGGIGLAPVRGDADPVIDGLIGAWRAGGLPAHRYPDWRRMKWSKLVANLVGNATSALLDREPAAIYRDADLYRVERAQLAEALEIMRRIGLRPVGLPGAPVPALALAVALPAWLGRPVLARAVSGARGGKDPSLRLNLTGSGATRSEAPWLNGAVAREARRLGIPAPTNEVLAQLVSGAATEPDVRARFRGRPDRLLEALAPRPVAGAIPDDAGASSRR